MGKRKPTRTEEKAEKVRDARMRVLGEAGEVANSQADKEVRIVVFNRAHYSPSPSAIPTHQDPGEVKENLGEVKENSENVEENRSGRGRCARGENNGVEKVRMSCCSLWERTDARCSQRWKVFNQSEDLPEIRS